MRSAPLGTSGQRRDKRLRLSRVATKGIKGIGDKTKKNTKKEHVFFL